MVLSSGLSISEDQVKAAVCTYMAEHNAEIEEFGYNFGYSDAMKHIRDHLKHADTQLIKKLLDQSLLEKLGPKDQAKSKAKPVVKAEPKVDAAPPNAAAVCGDATSYDTLPENIELHDPK